MTRLFWYYLVTLRLKQQLFLSYGWGENEGEKQDWLSAPHFAKCSSGQYITRKQTDRLRKRTERHQWSIVCSQGAPSNSSGSQYIKETKIYYTICTEMFYKYKLRHLCFFGLIKALRAVMYESKYVWACSTDTHTYTHTLLPLKVWNLSNPPLQLPFNAGKMHYLCAVKWTLCYFFKAGSLSSILCTKVYYISCSWALWPSCISSALQIMTDIKWLREADLQSAARAIFTLAQIWPKVFFQHCNAMVESNGYLMWGIMCSHTITYCRTQIIIIKRDSSVLLNHLTRKCVKKVSHDSGTGSAEVTLR